MIMKIERSSFALFVCLFVFGLVWSALRGVVGWLGRNHRCEGKAERDTNSREWEWEWK